MNPYTLMNRDTEVLDFTYDSAANRVASVDVIYDLSHAPLSVYNDRLAKIADLNLLSTLNRWWVARGIPESRFGLKSAQAVLGFESPRELAVQALGLSLSDQYWIRPHGSNFAWKNVNYFDNDFDDEIGLILANEAQSLGEGSSLSPSATVDGNLPKRWTIDGGGNRVLLKAGSGVLKQEPFNEVIATELYRCLFGSGEYVSYTLRKSAHGFYSCCQCMVDEHHEFVKARDIYYSHPANNGSMDVPGYEKACERMGIEGVRDQINRMVVCDYILGNIDRHGGNFGAIRNTITREFEGVAPLFDSGLSLLSYQGDQPQDIRTINANPFAPLQQEQLALVNDFSWFNPEGLKDFPEFVTLTLQNCPSRYMDEERLAFIEAFVSSGIGTIAEIATNCSSNSWQNLGLHERADRAIALRVQFLAQKGFSPTFLVD